jgi:GT2 family glycosyltransferase
VGFRLFNEDGDWQLSTGQFPNLFATLRGLLLPRHLRKYIRPDETQPSEVDWVTGCCLLVRRECLADVKGLDPDYFLYYEDVDLCQRARQHGWSVWFDPTHGIVHHRPLHSRIVAPHMRLITRHALLTYARKHWSWWQQRFLGGIVRLEAAFRRFRAWRKGEEEACRIFGELGQLIGEVQGDDPERAWKRLRRVVRMQEQQLAANVEPRDPLPQSARLAPALSGQPQAARAGGYPGSRGG